jgi:O-antigen/teichoic acid export membrane protein
VIGPKPSDKPGFSGNERPFRIPVSSWKNSRVVKGVGVNFFAQFVGVTAQFVSVPVYLTHWGASVYGIWIIMFTLPSYVALFDLGFTTAAGNDMTLATAAGDRAAASRTFQSLSLGVLIVSALGIALTVLVVFLLPDTAFPGAGAVPGNELRFVIVLLVAYALASINTSVVLAGFRSARMYPRGTVLATTISVAEISASLGVAFAGGGLLQSAIAFAAIRVAAVPVMYVLLRLKVNWLRLSLRNADISRLTRLLPASLATMALPIGFAITLQGTILALAVSLPPALIAVYTSVRTLTRVAFQFAAAVSNGVSPEFTVMVGQKNSQSASRLFVVNFLSALAILIPAVFVLALFGSPLVHFWTAGTISASRILIIGLAVATAIHGMWHFMVALLRAANRYTAHDAYLYPFAALATCVLVGFVVKWFGLTAAIYPNILLEALVFAVVLWQCRRYEEFRWSALRNAATQYLSVFRPL